jgi:hypothetical protein
VDRAVSLEWNVCFWSSILSFSFVIQFCCLRWIGWVHHEWITRLWECHLLLASSNRGSVCFWYRLGGVLVADGSAKCCGFGHQARALLAADGSAVASGIKLGRCWLLMEVICAVASGIKLGHCWWKCGMLWLRASSSGAGIIYPNDNGENLIEHIVLCKQSTIISY